MPDHTYGATTHPHAARTVLALLLALALLAPAFAKTPPAQAADCTVATASDVGPSSLRAALANTGSFTDCTTITITATGSLTLTGSLPTIRRALTITGPGAGALTIQGDGTFPLLAIDAPGQAVSITRLTLAKGHAVGGYGGNLRSSGGNLSLTDVALTSGTADADLGGAGAYLSNGTSTLTRVTISGNVAPGSITYQTGAGLFVDEYYGPSDLTILDSTIVGNTATGHNGGGLAVVRDSGQNRQLSVRLTNTIIGTAAQPNRTSNYGGGVYHAGGTLTINGSTFNGNQALLGGGAIYGGPGTLTLTNSTLSGNTASEGFGGGLYGYGDLTTLGAVTLVANSAKYGGGGIYTSGDPSNRGTTTFRTSIIAGNLGGAPADCFVDSPANSPLTSAGDNLVGNGTGCPATVAGDLALTTNLTTVLESNLAENGGPTRTHNLVPGGIAVDRIPSDRCGVPTDQRGVIRPQNGKCDIGAVEYTATPPSPCGQRFGDVFAADPACVAIEVLAARSIINGCDSTAVPPLFCPTDITLRHQMAALIVRAIPGWSAETYTNGFTDPTDDAELWRRVGTLQHYGVVGGYTAASCQAQGKTPPCYGPLDPVLKAQAISFVTRALVKKGYWVQQPTDLNLYGGVLNGTGHETDASTYWYYTRSKGGVPDYPETGSFPLDQAATRAWFARLLWTAIQGTPAAP